ncbi:MFS transporter [Sphingomonas ginkgonis]|uniref:MFS transporter n=1 Tax=Sphingomonas ginkgonis TaxID=2315330 RepID=A0A3R9WNQ2_9SPHN|nr:MFS transporter [Sphingomonas ginkgonis]RST30679.1 MFS transporter [Sphingomonas ginkgonis]
MTAVRARLGAMMFLQYFVWGAWWVPFGTYLSHHGLDAFIGTIFSTQGWAAIAAPLFVGAIADRHFAAEKVMGVLHVAGGVALLLLPLAGTDPTAMFLAALLVLGCYMPTIALSNTIAFNALTDSERQFPAIRVMGTIGWIVAGLIVGAGLHAEATALPIRLAGVVSLGYGLYSFTLPTLPPRAEAARPSVATLLGLDAIGTMRDRSFWVLIGCSLLLMLPLSFYYAYANPYLVEIGVPAAASVQAIGQVSEIFFLLALPLFFRTVGIKGVLILGMLGWAARYLLFAHGYTAAGPTMPLVIVALALHGVCFDFFFVAGQIYVDKRFPPETRNRAQSFLSLVTWGVGSVIGSLIANAVYVAGTHGTGHDWNAIWTVPAGLAAVVAIIFALLFRERRVKEQVEVMA